LNSFIREAVRIQTIFSHIEGNQSSVQFVTRSRNLSVSKKVDQPFSQPTNQSVFESEIESVARNLNNVFLFKFAVIRFI
jgi:hypothetical protein